MIDLRIVLSAVLAAATGTTAGAQEAYRPVRGVFSLGNPDKPVPEAVFTNPRVDGVALRVNWKTTEPARGAYNWNYLDKHVAAAAAAGKTVSLSVQAGSVTPDWVYGAGAAAFTFTDGEGKHTIPVPWDATFLANWQRFVQALGSRYGGNPAVVLVKITGVNATTPETMLPHTPADVTNWQQIGYTRGKVAAAWQACADSFARAFPRTKIALIHVPNGFPPLDDRGQPMRGTKGDWVLVNDLIRLGADRYGAQLAVENHGLSSFWVSEEVAKVANKLTTGYQMLWYVTGDKTGRMNNWVTPFDPHAVLAAAVAKGIAAGARYLEIYQPDVLNNQLQDVLADAQRRLRP